MKSSCSLRTTARCVAVLPFFLVPVSAGEGPTTGGGGLVSEPGTTIEKDRFVLSIGTNWTRFEDVKHGEAIAGAIDHGAHDAADQALVQTLGLRYGVSKDVELALRTSFSWIENLIVARPNGDGGANAAYADVRGFGDLWLHGKWRFQEEENTHIAALFGLKLPIGADNERDSSGTRVDVWNQPSTGAVDYAAGMSYTRYVTSRIAVDASAIYTLRGRDRGFQVGDRFDAGISLEYALDNEPTAYPHWSVSGELFAVRLEKNQDHDELVPNSGSTTFFLVPGLRCQWSPNLRLHAELGVPVSEELAGEQANTRLKAAFGLEMAF